MILIQGQAYSLFFPITGVMSYLLIGKGNSSGGGLLGMYPMVNGGTTSSGNVGRAGLAAGDTDVVGPIDVLAFDLSDVCIGEWHGIVLPAYPSTGDPLSSAVPAAYPVGSAGYKIGNNLDQPVGTRLPTTSYTAPNNSAIAANGVSLANIISGLTTGSYLIQLTPAEFDALIAAVWQTADQIETGFTSQAAMRLILSAAAAKLGIVGTVVKIRDVNDTKDRITATTDAIGQRTAVTTNVS